MRKSKIDLASKYYDLVYAQRPDVDFYVDMVTSLKGPVLEAGCGTGRILVSIASKGINITGLDLSKDRLKICQSKIKRLMLKSDKTPFLYNLNMTDFRIPQKFAVVIVPFRGIQFVTDPEEQINAMKSFARHLKPGGYLMLDLFNPSIKMLADNSMYKSLRTSYRGEKGEEILVIERVTSRNYVTQTITIEEKYVVNFKEEILSFTNSYSMRYSFRFEIEYQLRLAGFAITETFSDFRRRPWGDGYPKDIIIIAQKAH